MFSRKAEGVLVSILAAGLTLADVQRRWSRFRAGEPGPRHHGAAITKRYRGKWR